MAGSPNTGEGAVISYKNMLGYMGIEDAGVCCLAGADNKSGEKMAEIRLVNRAKWTLIRTRSMDEAEAHRWIEKQAMDRCLTKREIAAEIIKDSEV